MEAIAYIPLTALLLSSSAVCYKNVTPDGV